jgi:hypothetical protein
MTPTEATMAAPWFERVEGAPAAVVHPSESRQHVDVGVRVFNGHAVLAGMIRRR